MKKLLTLVILFASSFSNTAPIWAEFQIEVDDPIKAASIAAAAGGKLLFKGRCFRQ